MGCLIWILGLLIQSFSTVVATVIAFAVIIYTLKVFWRLISEEPISQTDDYGIRWFGEDPLSTTDDEDTTIRPFKVSVPEEVLEDLKTRLERTRYEDPVSDSKFQYGFNPNFLKKVVDYWRRDYDWRKQEARLNQYPQFKTRIEGIDVHFLHVKPEVSADSKIKVLPLVLIHGWPGSVVEFYQIIPLLTTPRPGQSFVFEVICPSIPGYGFSESPHKKGFTVRAAGRIFVTLMDRLGFKEFYMQGGDWGSIISNYIAMHYPSRISGVHLNMHSGGFKLWGGIKLLFLMCFPFFVKKEERQAVHIAKRSLKNLYKEMGYAHIQSTKPDTVGCGMSDSPAGLAAYILEKFSFWTNPEYLDLEDGGVTKRYSTDDLLTNVMVYWVNNNFTASARFYKENLVPLFKKQFEKLPVTVPTAIAVFPNELTAIPKTCLSPLFKNLVSFNVMARGGHFAAFEEPELLANDIWKFVSITQTFTSF